MAMIVYRCHPADSPRASFARCRHLRQMASAIADAIRDAGLNLNPAVDGSAVRVPVPKPSKETRDATLKLVSKIGEAARGRIRRVRQAAMDKLKKVEGAWVFATCTCIERLERGVWACWHRMRGQPQRRTTTLFAADPLARRRLHRRDVSRNEGGTDADERGDG